MPGPLAGLKVVEMAGLGPAPFCGMLLADMGAQVLRITRPGPTAPLQDGRFDVFARGKQSIAADLRDPAALAAVLDAVAKADAAAASGAASEVVATDIGLTPEEAMAATQATPVVAAPVKRSAVRIRKAEVAAKAPAKHAGKNDAPF